MIDGAFGHLRAIYSDLVNEGTHFWQKFKNISDSTFPVKSRSKNISQSNWALKATFSVKFDIYPRYLEVFL